MFFLLMIVTLLISAVNAWSAGSNWLAARMQGGFAWWTTLSAAVLSSIGFSMIYAVIILYVCLVFHLVSPHVAVYFNALYPAFIIMPLLMAGLIVTVQSWKAAFASGQGGLERTLNIASAVWNTYAMSRNILETPAIFQKAFSVFEDRDSDNESIGVATGLAILALMSGALTTWFIIRRAVASSVERMHTVLKENGQV